ncbi:MAG TPA: hypothetical protein VGH33_18195 [Isosphaeraceae bacterium]
MPAVTDAANLTCQAAATESVRSGGVPSLAVPAFERRGAPASARARWRCSAAFAFRPPIATT